jgi:glycosyltransferase involved in cell wall biosynthesis
MKVLHIIWNAKFGGIEKLVYDLAVAQNELEGIEAHIFIAKEEGEFLDKFKVTNLQLYFSKLKKGFDLNLIEYRKIRLLFKKYEVVHFHIFNPLLILCAIGLKSKIVFTEHGNFGFGRKKKRTDAAMNLAKKYFLKYFASWITYNSHFTKKNTEGSYGLRNQRNTSVVYNGIQFLDLESKPLSNEISELTNKLKNKVVIGTSSRFVSFKRIDRLISAFSKIENIERAVLLLVGDGILISELKKQVEELGIRNSVIFAGYVSNVRDFQQLMNVCVFPSQSEPFGLVAIETLSLNKPTIVFSDGGGLKEIIEKNVADDVINNESELAERLNYYINNVEHVTEVDTSRVDYAKEFSIEIACKKFNDIYRQIR